MAVTIEPYAAGAGDSANIGINGKRNGVGAGPGAGPGKPLKYGVVYPNVVVYGLYGVVLMNRIGSMIGPGVGGIAYVVVTRSGGAVMA